MTRIPVLAINAVGIAVAIIGGCVVDVHLVGGIAAHSSGCTRCRRSCDIGSTISITTSTTTTAAALGAESLWPVLGLQLDALVDGVDQRLLQLRLVELGHHLLLDGLVFLATGVDLRDEQVEVGIGAQGALGDELLAARGALLVARTQGGHNAVGAEAVQALLRRHSLLQHVQADGTHQFAVEAPRGHRDLRAVRDHLLRLALQLVQRQLPRFVWRRSSDVIFTPILRLFNTQTPLFTKFSLRFSKLA